MNVAQMGDAADDVYESEMRQEALEDAWMKGIRDACEYSILGRKPCRVVSNWRPQGDAAPYRCAHCNKEFDYP